MFSTILMKEMRWLISCGTRNAIEMPSIAVAVPAPNFPLIAFMIALEVVKSWVCTFKTTVSDFSNAVSTVFSTVAPPGMRPELVGPVETLDPAALASTVAIVNDPCASA